MTRRTRWHGFTEIVFGVGEIYDTPITDARVGCIGRPSATSRSRRSERRPTRTPARRSCFPRPVELRETTGPVGETQAELAWQFVLPHGAADQLPRHADVARCRHRAGGARPVRRRVATLCEHLPAEGPELLGYRKQFLAAFGAAVRQAQAGVLPPSRSEAKAALDNLQRALAERKVRTTGREGES